MISPNKSLNRSILNKTMLRSTKDIKIVLPNRHCFTVQASNLKSMKNILNHKLVSYDIDINFVKLYISGTNDEISWDENSENVWRMSSRLNLVLTKEHSNPVYYTSHKFQRKIIFEKQYCDECNKTVFTGLQCKLCYKLFHYRCIKSSNGQCNPFLSYHPNIKHVPYLSLPFASQKHSNNKQLLNPKLVKKLDQKQSAKMSKKLSKSTYSLKSNSLKAFSNKICTQIKRIGSPKPTGRNAGPVFIHVARTPDINSNSNIDSDDQPNVSSSSISSQQISHYGSINLKRSQSDRGTSAFLVKPDKQPFLNSFEHHLTVPGMMDDMNKELKLQVADAVDSVTRSNNSSIVSQVNIILNDSLDKILMNMDKFPSLPNMDTINSQIQENSHSRLYKPEEIRKDNNFNAKDGDVEVRKRPTIRAKSEPRQVRVNKVQIKNHTSLSQSCQVSWEIFPMEVEKSYRIGSGSYGTVYKGYWHGDVAIKELSSVEFPVSRNRLRAFQREVAVLRKTRHTNVLLFLGYMLRPKLAIVTQWCCGSSLYKHIHVLERSFSLDEVIDIALQIAQGMEYLHARMIIHRDLKSSNIFLHENVVKIGDFGLSTVKSTISHVGKQHPTGSVLWMAPEVIRMDKANLYSDKSDVYSFGIVLYELVTLKLPYTNISCLENIILMVGKGLLTPNFSLIKITLSPQFKNLMSNCLKFHPQERPGFTQIHSKLESVQKSHVKLKKCTSEPNVTLEVSPYSDEDSSISLR